VDDGTNQITKSPLLSWICHVILCYVMSCHVMLCRHQGASKKTSKQPTRSIRIQPGNTVWPPTYLLLPQSTIASFSWCVVPDGLTRHSHLYSHLHSHSSSRHYHQYHTVHIGNIGREFGYLCAQDKTIKKTPSAQLLEIRLCAGREIPRKLTIHSLSLQWKKYMNLYPVTLYGRNSLKVPRIECSVFYFRGKT